MVYFSLVVTHITKILNVLYVVNFQTTFKAFCQKSLYGCCPSSTLRSWKVTLDGTSFWDWHMSSAYMPVMHHFWCELQERLWVLNWRLQWVYGMCSSNFVFIFSCTVQQLVWDCFFRDVLLDTKHSSDLSPSPSERYTVSVMCPLLWLDREWDRDKGREAYWIAAGRVCYISLGCRS